MRNNKSEKRHIKVSFEKLIFIIAALWIVSILGTWYFTGLSYKSHKNSLYVLLNPRLETFGLDTLEARNEKVFATLAPLKEQLMSQIGENRENVAFYAEDLNSGSWIGWKEREPFVPASLLKVPIAIGVMKKVEGGEWSFDKKFVIEEKYKDSYFGELWKLPDGTEKTVEELLKEMLQNSDNTAANIFFNNLSKSERENVYYHIGMVNPEINLELNYNEALFTKLSAKELASMFRALYNATYLKRSSSQYILELLTDTKFDEVVPTTVPKDIKIAHKIANYYNRDPKRLRDYHDCGIAYLPKHPYLYCVMTQGYMPEQAEPVITSLGDKIYYYFEKGGTE